MNSALMLHRHAGPAVAGSYTLGALLGAATTCSALLVLNGLLSPIPASARGVVAAASLVLLALHVLGVLCLDFLPERRYQIPRETFTLSPPTAAFRFAFELGTGVRTYITSVSPYAAAVLVALCLPQQLSAAIAAAAAMAFGYGLGRSLVVAIQSLRKAIAVEHPAHWLRAADTVAVGLAITAANSFISSHS